MTKLRLLNRALLVYLSGRGYPMENLELPFCCNMIRLWIAKGIGNVLTVSIMY